MRIIAFITDAPAVREILAHLGGRTLPPRIALARGPPDQVNGHVGSLGNAISRMNS